MRLERIIYIAGIILLILLWLDTCGDKNSLHKSAQELSSYKDTVKYFEAKNGALIASNEAVRTELSVLLELNGNLKDDLKNQGIKNPTSITRVRTELRIDTVTITLKERIPCDTPFEVPFEKDEEFFKMAGRITNDALFVDSLSLPNTQQIIVGERKNGLFRRKSYVVTATNSNPHMVVLGLQSYTIENRPAWYQRWYVKVGAGLVGGYFLFSK